MRAARTAPAIGLCVVLVGLVLPACQDVVQPCLNEQFNGNGVLIDERALDGQWALKSIDGQTIPSSGYKLPPDIKKPFDPPIFLKFGTLYFSTDEAGFDDRCRVLTRSEGSAVVEYGTTTVATTSLNNIYLKSYVGRFHHNAEANNGYLGAGKYEAPMTIAAAALPYLRAITIRTTVDLFVPDVTYTLVFVR